MLCNLIPDAACVVLCAAAAFTDVRTRRIPNALTLPAIPVGFALSFILYARTGLQDGFAEGLLPSLFGAAFLFGAFALFYAARGVGAGDVKLMAAVGSFLRWPAAIWALAFVLFAGAFAALVYATATGQIADVARNMAKSVQRRLGRSVGEVNLTPHTMPYGPAILLGATATVLFRYRYLL